MEKFKELQMVALKNDIPQFLLKAGDVGTVVLCRSQDDLYDIELANVAGKTITVLTLTPEDIRSVYSTEILRVREI